MLNDEQKQLLSEFIKCVQENNVAEAKKISKKINQLNRSSVKNKLRKNSRGPIAGKPKPQEAKIIAMVNSGMTQAQIATALDLPDEDPIRKIRRIVRKLEAATANSELRRHYQNGINAGKSPEDYLVIFSADYDASNAFPDLAAKGRPELLTKDELFNRLDASHKAAIDSIAKKSK